MKACRVYCYNDALREALPAARCARLATARFVFARRGDVHFGRQSASDRDQQWNEGEGTEEEECLGGGEMMRHFTSKRGQRGEGGAGSCECGGSLPLHGGSTRGKREHEGLTVVGCAWAERLLLLLLLLLHPRKTLRHFAPTERSHVARDRRSKYVTENQFKKVCFSGPLGTQ